MIRCAACPIRPDITCYASWHGCLPAVRDHPLMPEWSEAGVVPGASRIDPAEVDAVNKVAACLDRKSTCHCVTKDARCDRYNKTVTFAMCRSCLGC